jgi:hypothetical protein
MFFFQKKKRCFFLCFLFVYYFPFFWKIAVFSFFFGGGNYEKKFERQPSRIVSLPGCVFKSLPSLSSEPWTPPTPSTDKEQQFCWYHIAARKLRYVRSESIDYFFLRMTPRTTLDSITIPLASLPGFRCRSPRSPII